MHETQYPTAIEPSRIARFPLPQRGRAASRPFARLLLSAAVLIGGVALQSTAAAQTYPTKPVRMVVAFAPGGPASDIGRVLGEKVQQDWKQTVVIDNRGGAGGAIAADIVAKAPPDGYTLLLNASNHVTGASLYKWPYHPVNDFTPIIELASYDLVLLVHPSLPVRTLKEFIELAKARPGKLTLANAGTGTGAHIATELFRQSAGIDFVHVPYKGSGPAMIDLLGGQVDASLGAAVSVMQYIKTGKLRAIATTGKTRVPELPDVPTIAESGFPGFESSTWFGIFGPKGMPQEIVQKLNRDFAAALRQPDVQAMLKAQSWRTLGGSPESFGVTMRTDLEKYAKVVKDAGITLESK